MLSAGEFWCLKPEIQGKMKVVYRPQLLDYYRFLGNCPPTPPLSQH